MSAKIVDRLSASIKQEVVSTYVEGIVPVRDICKQYGFGRSVLMDIVREAGVSYRNPCSVGCKRSRRTRTCSACGAPITVLGAKYCCYCGTKILADKNTIIKKLESLTSYFVVLNVPDRDKYIKEINDIIADVRQLKVSMKEEKNTNDKN